MKKKIYILVIAICSLFVHNIHAEHTFYVYQNTGVIDAFFTYEVDSIVYSNLDLDSVWHETSQVQEIWTIDSVYRIPLEIIDSVSFITPETEYKEGVINMSDNLMDYLIRCDSMTLFFRGNTSVDILPEIGDKIVTTEMNDILPSGFVGEVLSVTLDNNEYVVVCTEVALIDVFETYYSLGMIYGYTETQQMFNKRKIKINVNPELRPTILPSWTFSIGNELGVSIDKNDNIALNYANDISLSVSPVFVVKFFLQIDKGEYYLNYLLKGDFTVTETVSITGSINVSKEKELKKMTRSIPISAFIDFYYGPGLYIDANLSAAFSAKSSHTFGFCFSNDFNAENEKQSNSKQNYNPVPENFTMEGSVEGALELGAYLECGFKCKDKRIANISLKGKVGGKFSGSSLLYKDDLPTLVKSTEVYDRFSNSELSFDLVGGVEFKASVLEFILDSSASIGYKQSYAINVNKWDLVPQFNDVSFIATDVFSDARSIISGHCLFPVEYGYSVRNKSNIEIDKYRADREFKNGSINHEHLFSSYGQGSEYILYPTVKWLGFEMLASPSAPLKEKEWVIIKDFVVTDTLYSELQELEYEGEKYFYMHKCDVTVKLQDTTGVVDWGYIYVDPQGDSTFISLMSFGDIYKDSRYAYYRNNAEDSLILLGYATFRNGDQYIGENCVFDLIYNHYCKDEEHYHAVDLGLSSNILWACYNLGATSPEDYGEYYAYAEKTTKNKYSERNYLFFYYDYQFDGQYSYYESIPGVGADISGSVYDVVAEQWGEGWRMPTHKEMQELVDSCTWTWTTKEGVIGYKVTGPNGNSIFLPASGAKYTTTGSDVLVGKTYDYAGDPNKLTWYRSSVMSSKQLGNDGFGYTYGIKFKQDVYDCSDACMKYAGYVIRPVKDKEVVSGDK